MTAIFATDLEQYLESRYNYRVLGMVDLDWLMSQPRKTLFALFKKWHKQHYESDERIVLFSQNPIPISTLEHIQRCGSQIDISNFFILLCSPGVLEDELESVKTKYSTDQHIFQTLIMDFLDPKNEKVPHNPSLELSQSFCFRPWAHLEISSDGECKPCCVYKESIKKPDGRPFNINVDSIEDVYTSTYLKNLRAEFLNGGRPNECANCWYKEQTHGQSNRHWFTDHLGVQANLLSIEQESIENLITLDIKLGNLCNFKCRICDPTSSSRIAEERVKHFGSMIDLKSLNTNGRWIDRMEIWKTLQTLGKQLVNIDFFGGEPFLVKQQETFLDYLIEKSFSQRIRLHYNTNGSIFPEALLEKWKQFNKIDIAFSIDNVGCRFELERGGSWQQINDNLDRFLTAQLSNMTLSVFSTVSAQNVFYINELVDWFESKNFNKLTFNLLESPSFMNITNMSPDLTDLCVMKLNQIDTARLYKYNIVSIIEMLEKNKNTHDQTTELADFMKKLDYIRNENFSLTHPEIANLIYRGK